MKLLTTFRQGVDALSGKTPEQSSMCISNDNRWSVLLFWLLLFPFLGFSQTDNPTNFCGGYKMPAPATDDPDLLMYDRFGNAFEKQSLLLPENPDGGQQRMMSGGYFHTTELGNPPEAITDVVDLVLRDVSNIIRQRTAQTDCGALPPLDVELQVVWINFANPDQVLKAQLGLPDLPPAGAGIGTAFYSQPYDHACHEVALDRPFIKINGGRPDPINAVDGWILINSNLPSTQSCPNVTWNLDPAATDFPCQMDLYTVVLHELMHVLGYSSRMAFTDAYSLWDQSLRLVDEYVPGGGGANPQNFISSDCIQNCWTPMADFKQLGANTCHPQVVAPDVVVGDEAWAAIAGDPTIDFNNVNAVNNMFSHLSETCNGQNIHYVMRPGLATNEFQRTITDPELNIFCELGYEVVSSTVNCSGCYNIAHEDFHLREDAGCCYKAFYACRGESITIMNSDLLCNDISNGGEQTVTAVYPWFMHNSPWVTPNATNDGWIIQANFQDDVLFHYTVKGCDCKMHTAQFYIFIDKECPDCSFTPDECDNLLCDGDFEQFINPSGQQSRFEYPLLFEGAEAAGSPDINVDASGSHYVHVEDHFNREAVCLEIQPCVMPGCSLTLELDLSKGPDQDQRLEIWGSEQQPCPATVLGAVPLNNNCGTTTQCSPTHSYAPECIASIATDNVYINDLNPNFEHIDEIVWVNNTDHKVCYLTFVPSGQNHSYFDNIVALQKCAPEVTCNTAPTEVCAGGTQESTLTWQVCAEDLPGAASTTMVVEITLPPGVVAADPSQLSQTVTISEGECVDLTVDVISTLPIGTVVEATLSGQASGVCTKVSFNCTVPITIVHCDPPLCECTVPGSLNINAGTGTSVLNTAIHGQTVAGQNGYRRLEVPCLSIAGNLLIDNAYLLEIDADEIIMNPGAEITVKTGSNLDIVNAVQNGGIHGCDIMWRGITVEPSARLLLFNNTIQDAQYAVTGFRNASKQPLLRINNTTFNRNHVGVRITDPIGVFTNLPQEGLFTGNEFSCTSTMLPTFDPISNYLNNAPFAGIELHRARFVVGVAGNTVVDNKFNNLRNGIAAERSDVQVYAARFTQMVGGGPSYSNGFAIYDYEPATFDGAAGIGILNLRGLDTRTEYSIFNDMYKGVNTTFSHVSLLNNNLDQVTIGFDIVKTDNRNITVQHNNIGFRQNGIRNSFSNAPLSLSINENENIHLIPYTPDPNFADNKAGISSSGSGGGLLPEGSSISYNTINLPGLAHGIQVRGGGNIDLFSNHVNFQGLQDEAHNAGFSGIAVRISRLNYLNGNMINSDNTSKHTWGMVSGAHESGVFCCNTTNSTYIGFHLSGWCDQSRIRKTTLDNIYSGLTCQNGTVIGPQINAGNLWNAGYNFRGASHSGSQAEVNQSLFRVELPMNDPLWPNQRHPATGWFNPASGNAADNCSLDAECPTVPDPPEYGPGEGGDIRSTDFALLNNEFSDADYSEMLQFEGRRSLYRRIKSYPEMLGQDGAVDQFYYGAHESGMASLYEASWATSMLIPYGADQMATFTTLSSEIISLKQTMDALQVQLHQATDPAERSNLLGQLLNLAADQTDKITNLEALEAAALDNRSAQSDALLTSLNKIPDALTVPESNRKIVDKMFLETIGKGQYSLTESQRDVLLAIANQCPSEGGNAVYDARTLAGLGSGEYYFDDDELCLSQERFQSAAQTVQAETRLQLMPNPALDQVTVFVPEAFQKGTVGVRITDLTGKIWLENMPAEGQASIQLNVGRLPAGVYACQLIPESGKILTETLVLIR